MISFKTDRFDLLAVRGTLQHHTSNASVLWCSAFFTVQLSQQYRIIGKIIALTIWTFVGKVMSLVFNSLSRFVIAFLQRSNGLLILYADNTTLMAESEEELKSLLMKVKEECERAGLR